LLTFDDKINNSCIEITVRVPGNVMLSLTLRGTGQTILSLVHVIVSGQTHIYFPVVC